MANIAALQEDFTGGALGASVTEANSNFTDITGVGTSVFITDPFDGTRRMMEVAGVAAAKIHETDFTPVTLLWRVFDIDIETVLDANTEIFNAWDVEAATNKVGGIRSNAGARTLTLRNWNNVAVATSGTLADNTKYRVYFFANVASDQIRMIIYSGAPNFSTVFYDSTTLANATPAASIGHVRIGLMTAATGTIRFGRLRADNATQPFDTVPAAAASGSLSLLGAANVAGGPPAPTGLTATPVSSTQINLSWSAVSGASGYDIERNGVVAVLDHPTNSYSDTGRTPGTLYTYRVRAVD